MRRIYNYRLFSLQVGIQACLNCSCNQILGKPQEQATLTELSLTKLTTTTCIAHTHINTTAHTHTHTRMGLRMRISYYRIASLRKLIRLAKGCGRCHRTHFLLLEWMQQAECLTNELSNHKQLSVGPMPCPVLCPLMAWLKWAPIHWQIISTRTQANDMPSNEKLRGLGGART